MATGKSAENKLIIHADRGDAKISKHIYGHFAEHLGRCIYDGIWVGEDSAVPNTRGIRNDVVKALRAIRVPVLRWPGGCFADEYHWRDGVGPVSARRRRINSHWGGVIETNRFGTHEFMDLCEQVGCEPYICGNVGSGTVLEMQEWVEYLTFNGKTEAADLRRAHGREKAWPVKFWGVGNESWGCGGNMRAEFYADQFRRYATYCRNLGGNKLYKIACGASDVNYEWTEVLMREAAGFMDGLSLHYYVLPGDWEHKGSATEFDEAAWFTLLKKILLLDGMIAKHSKIMDRYDPGRRVGLIVDEWGAWYDPEAGTNPGFLHQQNTLRDALVAGIALNIFNHHCSRVQMANLAQTVNVLQALLLTEGGKMLRTPTYHVFDLFQDHQEGRHLPLELHCPTYKFGKDGIPAVTASASRSENGSVHLTLCSLDPGRALAFPCRLHGMKPASVSGRILTADSFNSRNTFAEPDAVQPAAFEGAELRNGTLQITLPAKSVVALEIR
jgi:alpha-N-arabinofuranosidase